MKISKNKFRMLLKIPNHKQILNPNDQMFKTDHVLVLYRMTFFGHWNLIIGHCLEFGACPSSQGNLEFILMDGAIISQQILKNSEKFNYIR